MLPNPSPEQRGVVYLLSDPREGSNTVYIGKTVKRLSARMNEHRVRALATTTHTQARSRKWLRYLYNNGLEPIVTVLEVVEPGDDHRQHLCEREIYFIEEYRRAGYDVCNHTDGGDGGSTHRNPLSAEARAAISAANRKEANPERARKISESKRRQWEDPDYRAKMLEAGQRGSKTAADNARGKPGRSHSESTKKKLRSASLGKQMSAETRAKISETLKSMPERTHPPGWSEKVRETWARKRLEREGGGEQDDHS